MLPQPPPRLEFWGGVECTVNRVGDRLNDQVVRTGHHHRLSDLDLFAELGMARIRYPFLWERIARSGPDDLDWSWSDARAERLQQLGIAPIAGLLHHGSGPLFTSLIDADFPEKFAQFAGQVAERYPHITDYMPLNEIVTTARFSGLYGLWHPHSRNDKVFARMIINQCRATVLAVREIRKRQPAARFIMAEDVGRTHSTAPLRYQADFDNERRWLAVDLVSGRLNRGRPMWNYLLYAGIRQRELEWFHDNYCVPDVFGVNYYVTSERFLDHRIHRYPAKPVGSNSKHLFTDVEAVRVLEEGIGGVRGALMDAWSRYGFPLALTEVHLACSSDEQIRWFVEAQNAAYDAREMGIDVRAITAWALLGAYDWNSLLTELSDFYEPGVFELRNAKPHRTALGDALKRFATAGAFEERLLECAGWWRRPARLLYKPHSSRIDAAGATRDRSRGHIHAVEGNAALA